MCSRTYALRVTPRRWQEIALRLWLEAGARGVVQVVTGGGKTVFAQMCMAEMFNRGVRYAIVVVPTLALLDQWVVCLQEELGLQRSEISTWSGRGKPTKAARVNVLVANTARRAIGDLLSRLDGTAMLVVDECHRLGSPENARALEGIFAATLGISATPEREFDDGYVRYLEPKLGPVIYRYGINEAAEDRILSSFDLINVEVGFLPDEAEEYLRLTRRIAAEIRAGATASKERLERLMRRRARVAAQATMRIPVCVALIERHRRVRSMIFHEDIEAAEKIRALLEARGHRASIYHSGISPAVRQGNLVLYRRGAVDVLVSCRALDEGINIPETQVAVIASSSASLRQRVQRLGRVLRPSKGKELATIYTIYVTRQEAARLRAEETSLTAARSVRWMRAGTRGAPPNA